MKDLDSILHHHSQCKCFYTITALVPLSSHNFPQEGTPPKRYPSINIKQLVLNCLVWLGTYKWWGIFDLSPYPRICNNTKKPIHCPKEQALVFILHFSLAVAGIYVQTQKSFFFKRTFRLRRGCPEWSGRNPLGQKGHSASDQATWLLTFQTRYAKITMRLV